MLYSCEFYKIIFIFLNIPLKYFAVPISPYFAKIGGTDNKLRKYMFQTLRVPEPPMFKNISKIEKRKRKH